jgi:hypothetical protein
MRICRYAIHNFNVVVASVTLILKDAKMPGGKLARLLIDAVRDLRSRVERLEARAETVHERCAKAPLERPACAAIGPRGGTLITPRHVMFARHYPLAVGATVKYDWGTRKVIKTKFVDTKDGKKTDIGVGLLDAPAPEDVTPARYLPWDWRADIRTHRDESYLQEPLRSICIKPDGRAVSCVTRSLGKDVVGGWPEDPADAIVLGDSGQPIFLLAKDPILLCCLQYKGSGPSFAHYYYDVLLTTAMEDGEYVVEGKL